MYEEYYGFAEKPFSLTPDPKYLYRSQSHADAFDLLQYAIRRREGFVVVTGDIGTGKTTLCRALLEEIDRTTFTALVLDPFLSEQDLLKRILQDFGVVSRENIRAGRLAGVRPAQSSIKATVRYHGVVPPAPVRPRGSGQLVLFSLLALTSLALIAAAGTRLAVLRRTQRQANR